MWYSGFNCFTVIVVGLVISFLTGRPGALLYKVIQYNKIKYNKTNVSSLALKLTYTGGV